MSFASKVLYAGNGATTQFNIPFPFLSATHVNVFVNNTLQLNPMNYTLSGSTVTFDSAPGVDAAISIRRNTSPTATLVDFEDGSVLNANALDTAYLHNYYLSQEYSDSFNELLNEAFLAISGDAGIVETETDEMIAALVAQMLGDAAADELQDRVNDIDANGEAIITLGEAIQVQINTLAQGVAAVVYVQDDEPVPGVGGIPDPIAEGARWYDTNDNNAAYIYLDLVWVSISDPRVGQAVADIDVLQVDVADNAAAIVDEEFARATEDTALAQTLSLIGAETDAGAAFLLDLSTVKVGAGETLAERFTSLSASDDENSASINTIQTVDLVDLGAKYGVTLDVNGHITGFAQNNDGETGTFIIVADKFAIVDPEDDGNFYVPLQYSGGVLSLQNVEINGSLMVNGSLAGGKLIAGTLGSTQIGANAITTTQLNASAVTAAKIAAGAITASKINVTNLAAITADLGSITAGNMTLNTSGYIRGGQTAYDTGAGFWLGYTGGKYKFSIGDENGVALLWDGTGLVLRGALMTQGGMTDLDDKNVGAAVTVASGSTATAGFKIDGKNSFSLSNGVSTLHMLWLFGSGYAASDFECRMITNSGSLSTGTAGSWLALSSSREWTRSRAAGSGAGQSDYNGTLQIRLASSGVIACQAEIDLSAIVI